MKNDLARFHGYNERISVRNYVEVVFPDCVKRIQSSTCSDIY